VFLFGPGFGECCAIRIPPNHWVIIDSCRIAERSAAEHLLDKYSGECSCLILTHRHRDHYRGFADLLDWSEWSHVGCSDQNLTKIEATTTDPVERLSNDLEDVFSKIKNHWQCFPESKWWTWRNSRQTKGTSELVVLHPDEDPPTDPLKDDVDANERSTAILVTWEKSKLLFSADILGSNWQSIFEHFGEQEDHCFLKIPHHGSRDSLHDCFMTGARDRLWAGTPFNKSTKLPDFADGGPVHQMQAYVESIYFTGLPIRKGLQARSPQSATRQEVIEATLTDNQFLLPGGRTGVDLPISDGLNNFIVFRFEPTGDKHVEMMGPGSISLVTNREGIS